MASAIVALATTTLGATAASVTFGSIPATYRDLRLVIAAKNSTNSQGIRAQFNDDTAANYSYIVMYGTGSSAASGAGSSLGYADLGVNRTTDQSTLVDIIDYSATDKHKTLLVRSDNSSELTLTYADRWASNSAITKIKVYPSDNSFTAGSTFSLYGIVSA